MILYTQFAASQEVPPPYHFPGATVFAFIFEARLGAVKDYCDKVFNLGDAKERGFEYRPASFWPYATLLFIDYPEMIAEPPPEPMPGETPYQDRGVIDQKEVFIALPVVRYGAGPERLATQTALEWALPFIAVQNPMSASCGREMLGLNKLLAEIDMGEGVYPGSFKGRVRLPGWRDPDAKQEILPFLDVDTAPALPTFRGRNLGERATSPLESPWSIFRSREAGWAFDGLVSAANLADDLTVGLAPTVMRTISLRQIRDAKDTSKALYQALVSCRSHFDNVREFHFFNERDVKIKFPTAGSFAEVLGLFLGPPKKASGAWPEIKPKVAYQFTADMDFDQMRTIYTYTKGDEDGVKFDRGAVADDLTSPWLMPWRKFFSRAS